MSFHICCYTSDNITAAGAVDREFVDIVFPSPPSLLGSQLVPMGLPWVTPRVSMGCRGRRRGAAWAPSASHGMPPHFSRCSNVCNGSPWAPLGSPIGRMGLLWVSMDSHWRRRGAAGAQHERHGPPMECHGRPKGGATKIMFFNNNSTL